MHIAVCDDNIADRKQTERLLNRASDQYIKEGLEGFFVDSYGSTESLMHTPQMYDAIFIDMVTCVPNGIEIARALRKAGASGQIILLSSAINYEELAASSELEDFHFMNKPLLSKDFRGMLDFCEARRINREPLVELRDDEQTVYAHGYDILYAKKLEAGRIGVKLTDGRELKILTTIQSFYELLNDFYYLLPASENALVNIRHINKIGMMSVVMTDGEKIHLSIEFNKYIRGQCESEKLHPAAVK